jgi:sialate O-acetylesterase
MVFKPIDRRWFMRATAGSVIAGLPLKPWLAAASPEPPQMIWKDNNDQRGSHPYPGNQEADIWVFTGQSNSQGWGMLKAPVEPDPRILFFDADNRWVVAREPLNPRFTNWVPDSVVENILLQRTGVDYPSGPPAELFVERLKHEGAVMGGVGPGLAFARQLVRFVDRPLGLLYCGVGGSPIKSWVPTMTSDNYQAMIRRIAMVGGKIKGLIWYQGESDAMTPGAEQFYQSALLELFDSIRKDTGLPDLPIICVQIARFVWNYPSHAHTFETIRDIQRRVAGLRPNLYSVSALDLPLEDPAHLSFEGQQRLGKRIAEIALSHVYKQADHGKTIDVKSIEVLQPEKRRPMVRVRFSGVTGKLTAPGEPTGFEVRSPIPDVEPKGPSAEAPMPIVYRVDFDPTDPAAVILGICDNALINSGGATFHPLVPPFRILYGPGSSPYVNIVDEKDIPVPAFGPIPVRGEGRTS